MPRSPDEADEGPSHEEFSAGGVVVRPLAAQSVGSDRSVSTSWEVLLGEQLDRNTGIRTVRLPKGHIDSGESEEQAALREVREETGRSARIVMLLGRVEYVFRDRRPRRLVHKHVVFYLMEDCGEAKEARDREMELVVWATIDDALARLSFETERDMLTRAVEQLSASAL